MFNSIHYKQALYKQSHLFFTTLNHRHYDSGFLKKRIRRLGPVKYLVQGHALTWKERAEIPVQGYLALVFLSFSHSQN